MNDIPPAIKDILEQIQRNFIERFKDNIKCLILYGSWSKGTAREDSDIDLLAIFNKVNKETGKSVYEIERGIETERCITIVSSGIEDFQKEKLPLYTAVKREGKVMYGSVDMSINHEPPELKYSDFFKKSCEFESKKIEIAEELLKKGMGSGIADLCFIASKHAIQSALAMKGEGYSSKVAVLSPLTERYFGKEIVGAFRKLFELYIKSEYGIEFLSDEEAKLAVGYAKKVFEVYDTVR
jgi:predicted nucleotidyltransferase